MHPPQKRLGRGLSSLIPLADVEKTPPNAADPAAASAVEPPLPSSLPIERLRPNPFQPRREIPPEQLKALADSIKKSGIIQPLAVRAAGDRVYEIIAGERRWRAAQLAGLSTVPVFVRSAQDEQMLEMALVENIYREDLNAIDRALAYRRYCDEFGLSVEDVAQRLGEDRSTVANYLRLLELPSDVKEWVAEGKLSMGHARAVLGLRFPTEMASVAKQVIDRGLSVRAVENLVRNRLNARADATRGPDERAEAKRAHVRNLEDAFTRALGTKAEIHEAGRKGRGKIVIHYFSLDDFDRIMERLGIEGV